MARQFDIGRQNEVLLNEKHYKMYKTMETYLEPPNPANPTAGPVVSDPERDPIINNAMWIDNYTDPNNGELKYYNNGKWNIFFKDKFQITDHITDGEEPKDAVQGQLWINNMGVMHFYDKGIFVPIKAVQADIGDVNIQGFEDFLIISPLEATSNKIVDNFSEFLFAETPIVGWEASKNYLEHQGCVHDLHIYMAVKAHTSANLSDLENKELWVRLDFLNQYLVPDSMQGKFYIDGHFVHEKVGFEDDPNEQGYDRTSNVCITFPVEQVENKLMSGVHVNPKRLHRVIKKVFIIDKANPTIEMQEENTEFYVLQGGIGKLLIKTQDESITEYHSVTSNNIDCIKLSSRIAELHEFVYCIHYEFTNTLSKQKGTLGKRKFKIKDENYIWIGSVPPSRVAVFGQGFFYENVPENYLYDAETGYIFIKEQLQDRDYVKQYDFSVLSVPDVHEGKVSDNFHPQHGYRINLSRDPFSTQYIAFCGGVQLTASALDVIDDPDGNTRVKYIPSLTKEIFEQNEEDMYWSVLGTNEVNAMGEVEFEMLRGTTEVINKDGVGNVVPIYRDKLSPVDGALYLASNEKPLLFVDGVLVFQKEIEIGNDFIKIYGLQETQEVLMLADTSPLEGQEGDDTDMDDHINSDRLLFEDTISFATVPTEVADDHIVFLQNGVLCDAGATYTSIKPKDEGYHGEVRLWINYSKEQWIQYNAYTGNWDNIPDEKMFIDPITQEETRYIDFLDQNVRGYSSTRRSITFLQKLEEQYCTYYAYKYSDSVERKLLMEYIYPNGRDGVNITNPKENEPRPFNINYKHVYMPGKNEITVFLNGIRQELESPYNIGFENSTNRESTLDKNDNFVLAFKNDENVIGDAIPTYEGYWTYKVYNLNEEKIINKTTELTAAEISEYQENGYQIETLSKPNRNVIFYVIEPCESGETKACDRKRLTYKDANASQGAFADNSYNTGDFLLTRGNIRVYVGGIRQPYGGYQTAASLEDHNRKMLYSYKILDSRTIQFDKILIGGMGGNEGTLDDPHFPIGEIVGSDGITDTAYHTVLDDIVIEIRRDYKLREITLPVRDNSGEFTPADGVPVDMFKTKDRIMIYINGLAYGKNYKIENQTLKLLDDEVRQLLGTSKNDVITFEWR